MKNTWLRKLLLSCLISSTFLTPALAEKSIKLANALSKESHYGVAATALEESLKQALP